MLPGRGVTFARRWASILIVAAVLLPVTVFQPYRNGPAIRSDGAGYHIWTYALLKGDLAFTWFEGDPISAWRTTEGVASRAHPVASSTIALTRSMAERNGQAFLGCASLRFMCLSRVLPGVCHRDVTG